MSLATKEVITKREEQRAIELELEAVQSYADEYGSFTEAINSNLRKSINLGYEKAKASGLRAIIDEAFEQRCRENNND